MRRIKIKATSSVIMATAMMLLLMVLGNLPVEHKAGAAAFQMSNPPIMVTNTDDSGDGSFRQAILDANAAAGADTIDFAPGVVGTINLASVLPSLSSDIEINGPGADLLTVRRDTGGDYRIFTVASMSTVSISGFAISNGNTGSGGGIFNLGALTLTGCAVSDNEASDGGGIRNQGALTVTNSTISGNRATASSSNLGGGINNQGGTVTLINSTISGNTATGDGIGGGIYNPGGTVTVINCTISGNTAGASFGGGGIRNSSGATTRVRNTIIAGNNAGTGPDVSGSFTSQGHNLISKGDGSSGFTDGVNDDQVGTIATPIDPMLGPLQDNGGTTLTHALLPDSPAIDAGDDSVLGPPLDLITDQRGLLRPTDGDGDGMANTDIGAFEAACMIDFEPPTVACPDDLMVNNDAGLCSAVVNFMATASDNCDGAITPVCIPASGSAFPVGMTTVTCSATDAAGNTGQCSFTVTVNDAEAPVITCPSDIIAIAASPGAPCVPVNFTVTASDNCPGVTVECVESNGGLVITSGFCFPISSTRTTVTCTATDAAGNTAQCSFNVAVYDVFLQDDSRRTTRELVWNSFTGDYIFCCDGVTVCGTGQVSRRGSIFSLVHYATTYRVKGDLSTFRGNASLQIGGSACTIMDRDIRDNVADCVLAAPCGSG